MEEYNLPLQIRCSSNKPNECFVITSRLECSSYSLLSWYCTLSKIIKLNNACDHHSVTIGHTCCWLTHVRVTLLTLIHCGNSPNEASSTLSTSEDHLLVGKSYAWSSLLWASHKPCVRVESDAQPLPWPLHTKVNFMRKHFARDTSIRLAICFCPLIKLSIMDERLGIIFTQIKPKHSQQTTCTPTS